jgi:long-chain acyl-CoA synthetase
MRTAVVPNSAASLVAFLADGSRTFADQPAYIEGETVTTYAEFWDRSAALSGFLHARVGVKRGDRVALMLPNVTAFPICTAAILRAGAVQVNVNPFYTARELRHQLEDAEAHVVIANAASLPALTASGLTGLASVIVADLPATAARAQLPEHVAVYTLEDAMTAGLALPRDWQEPEPQDLAFLQYTGGTTGVSKGAMLTHANIVANMRQLLTVGSSHFGVYPITLMTALPLYHIFALTVNMLSMLAIGACNVLIPDPRDLDGLVAQWARHRINFFTGVNTLCNSLGNHPGFAAISFAPELLALGGGAAVQKVVSERWRELTGRHILEGYGLSETSPILTCTPFAEERFLGSIGRAVPETDLVIRDEEGCEVPTGEVGELCARGPQVMQRYWRRPTATAAAMTPDDFFRTGDMARCDADQRYYIVDRQKDMILVSGFNVYPNEVEAVVAEVAGVAECACVGASDPSSGEAVVLYVVRRDETLDEAQVRAHCRRHLAGYKIPRHILFIPEMPKTSVGKILRRELRDLFAGTHRGETTTA